MCTAMKTHSLEATPELRFPLTAYRTGRSHLVAEKNAMEFMEGRERIQQVHTAMYQPEASPNGWAMRQAVLRACVGYTQNRLSSYLGFLLQHPKLTHVQFQFLIDTVGYIEKGTRMMSITNWEYVLREENLYKKSVFNDMKDTTAMQYMKSKGDPGLMMQWISHRTGWSDMISTLRLLSL